jgi:hypothetical protein
MSRLTFGLFVEDFEEDAVLSRLERDYVTAAVTARRRVCDLDHFRA